MPQRHPSGFTLVETLVVVGIIVVLATVLIPTLAYFRQEARRSASITQLRGIHQSLVVSAQTKSRRPMSDGYAGLDSAGEVYPDGKDTGHSGDGSAPAARYWWLLEGNFFTPEYIISPVDPSAVPAARPSDTYSPLTPDNFSYAMMALLGSENERAEWHETLNAEAIALSDRAIGRDAGDIASLWTAAGSSTWHGGVARNDNAVSFEKSSRMTNTQYGEGTVNATDDLFADDPNADDAFLVFEDAETSYSKR